MKEANLRMMNFAIFFVLIAIGCLISDVEACHDSSVNRTWIMEKDELDRLIHLWVDSTTDPSLNISIDNSPPAVISLSGQQCVSPAFDVTPEGDIIVTWTVLNLNTKVMDLYSASLPFGGSWSLPVMVSDGLESVVQGSNKMKATSTNKIDVSWESLIFFPSVENASLVKRELRTATSTISAWQPATTVGTITQYGG